MKKTIWLALLLPLLFAPVQAETLEETQAKLDLVVIQVFELTERLDVIDPPFDSGIYGDILPGPYSQTMPTLCRDVTTEVRWPIFEDLPWFPNGTSVFVDQGPGTVGSHRLKTDISHVDVLVGGPQLNTLRVTFNDGSQAILADSFAQAWHAAQCRYELELLDRL